MIEVFKVVVDAYGRYVCYSNAFEYIVYDDLM